MALPKLNAAPKYEVVVPSTGQQVRYRPYLVKEEKILMMAMESQDQKQALAAIVDTIGSCVQEDLNTSDLTTFDVEYLFTQIRSKSVGETAKIAVPCQHCETENEVVVKLDDIKVGNPPGLESKIQITDSIALQMRWPSYNELVDFNQDLNQTELTFKMIASCIDSVLTDEEAIKMKDEPEKERMDFIESLSSEQFDKIRVYVEKMPRMEHKVQFECVECKKGNDITLSGISDFF